jgi:SAM-dependent methyltransferase
LKIIRKGTVVRQASITESDDFQTAQAFSNSWKNLYSARPYSDKQVAEWLAPVQEKDVKGKKVLELGCGPGVLVHYIARQNTWVAGVMGCGDAVERAHDHLKQFRNVSIVQDDLVNPRPISEAPFDLVYCIGVLHHLNRPEEGFNSLLNLVSSGGRFHCWVYAHEGNAVIRLFVEPLRRVASRFPWYVTKYFIAWPLAIPFFFLSQLVLRLSVHKGAKRLMQRLPLYEYLLWISQSPFRFHHHVAFDQLVSPQTQYIRRTAIEKWLCDDRIVKDSTYIRHRNKNGWKFGGVRV